MQSLFSSLIFYASFVVHYLIGLSYGENESKNRSREVINKTCAYYDGLSRSARLDQGSSKGEVILFNSISEYIISYIL